MDTNNVLCPPAGTADGTSLRMDLDHPAYHARLRLRGYNGAVNIFQSTCPTDAGRLLRRLMADCTAEQHRQLARQHAEAAAKMQTDWNNLVDQASQQAFGRAFRVEDYRISGIARDEFAPDMKDRLRFAAHAYTGHKVAARAHWAAAGGRKFHL